MHDLETLRRVAKLHVESLDQGFLSTLGPKFLILMYQAIDECENSVLLVESSKVGVAGFVSGAEGMSQIYRQLLRHWPQLLASLLPSLLNPIKVWRICEILLHSRHEATLGSLPSFELLSIAVDPKCRGRGVSEQLYQGLTDHCRAVEKPAFKIIVGDALAPAHRFYQRMGAEVVGEVYVHGGGQRSLIYVQPVH